MQETSNVDEQSADDQAARARIRRLAASVKRMDQNAQQRVARRAAADDRLEPDSDGVPERGTH